MESAEKRDILVPQVKERGQVVVARQWGQDWPAANNTRVLDSQEVSDYDRRIGQIRNEFNKIRRGDLSKRELAFAVRDILELIVKIETGISSLERGIEILLEKLCANPAIHGLMKELYRQSARELQGITALGSLDIYDEDKVIRNLDIFVEWYSTRSESLAKIGWFEGHDNHFDQIFDLTAFQSRKVAGLQGLEARCGFAIFGRLYQPLWIKIYLLGQSGYVQARDEWSSWVDDIDVMVDDLAEISKVFSVVVPVTPSEQRFIADQVSFFIPYAALELPPGKHDITLEAALYDESGNCLTSVQCPESISIPYIGRANQKLISYQAMGIWPHDLPSGDKVSNMRVTLDRGEHSENREESIKIKSDLELWGHEGDEITIEARLYRLDGSTIERKILYNSKSVEQQIERVEMIACSSRRYLIVEESVEKWFNFDMKLVVNNIDIDEFPQNILVELCIINSHEKVLAGALHSLSMPRLKSKELENEQTKLNQGNVEEPSASSSNGNKRDSRSENGRMKRAIAQISRIFSNRPLD